MLNMWDRENTDFEPPENEDSGFHEEQPGEIQVRNVDIEATGTVSEGYFDPGDEDTGRIHRIILGNNFNSFSFLLQFIKIYNIKVIEY